MSQLAVSQARDIVASVTQDDDGAHVIDLLRLLKLADANESVAGEEAMRSLYMQTEDFNQHFQDFISRL